MVFKEQAVSKGYIHVSLPTRVIIVLGKSFALRKNRY